MGRLKGRWLPGTLALGLTLAAALLLGSEAGLWTTPPVTADAQALTEDRQLANGELLAQLTLGGAPLPYDRQTSTFYCPLSLSGTSWPGLVLRGTDAAGGAVALAFTDDYTAVNRAQAIRDGMAFNLLAYTPTQYKRYRIVFTGLPALSIHTVETPLDANYPITGGDTPSTLSLIDPGALSANRVFSCAAQVRIRGGASRYYPKKSYKLSLKTRDYSQTLHHRLLGMRNDDDWILYSLYNDPTKVRDKLSMAVWNAGFSTQGMNLPGSAMHMQYVELFINDRYWGLYGLMEPVDGKKLSLREDADPARSDYLYRSISYEVPLPSDYKTAADATAVPGYELRFPETPLGTVEKWAPLMALTDLMTLGTDPEFRERADAVLSIDSALNYWLYLQVVRGVDNGGKNVNYIARYTGNGHTMYFTPWDLDQTWGSQWNDTPPLFVEENMASAAEPAWFPPGNRLVALNVADSRSRAARQWASLRRVLLSDAVFGGWLSEYEQQVFASGAMARDKARWPKSPHADDLTAFNAYVWERLAWLDGYMDELGAGS